MSQSLRVNSIFLFGFIPFSQHLNQSLSWLSASDLASSSNHLFSLLRLLILFPGVDESCLGTGDIFLPLAL
ncbi:TPA: hypothetical protein G9F27_005667 [Salmonella enterica]|uniref:Uncharacterized protein n=1 Tax=Salmonella enterica TaxID=28901 RepID=A0A743ST07_SALER|nr:hypothetical protein [Salmonella enterica]